MENSANKTQLFVQPLCGGMEINMKNLIIKIRQTACILALGNLHLLITGIFLIGILNSLFLTGCTQNNQQIQTDESHVISADDAKDYALNHAGLTENQATFVRSERDLDDGTLKYDVEFYTNDGLEYDYEIDSSTGKVLSFDIDAKE